MDSVQTSQKKKLVVGWFSFTCCEDSTILLTELLNDNLDAWKKLVEFRYMRALKTKNDMTNLDVAFIEGAASSQKQEEEMRKIRANAKYRRGNRRLCRDRASLGNQKPVCGQRFK